MSAAVHCSENFDDVERVLNQLDSFEAASIRKSQEMLMDTNLKAELAHISADYERFPEFIEQLECTSQQLGSTLRILVEARTCVNSAMGLKAALVESKLERVLEHNPGLEMMMQTHRALQGGALTGEVSKYSPAELSAFSPAPMVSVDVERSFSQYISLLCDRRHSLTPQNARLHLITLCDFPKSD